MKKTIEMILMTLLIMLAAAFVGTTLMSCSSSSDEESEQGGTPDKYGLVIYDNPAFASEVLPQAYSNLIPNTQAPYRLFVMPYDEEGKAIIRELAEDKDIIIGDVIPHKDSIIKEGYWIKSNNYFESPHLYVSANYLREMEGMNDLEYALSVFISPIITIKMKQGYDINRIKKKYNLTGLYSTGTDMLYDYCCNANNAPQVMKIVEEIRSEDGVEWVEFCRLYNGGSLFYYYDDKVLDARLAGMWDLEEVQNGPSGFCKDGNVHQFPSGTVIIEIKGNGTIIFNYDTGEVETRDLTIPKNPKILYGTDLPVLHIGDVPFLYEIEEGRLKLHYGGIGTDDHIPATFVFKRMAII